MNTEPFEQQAGHMTERSLPVELWSFVSHTKKWWLLPILVVLLLFAALLFLSLTPAAPFIYTLF